MGSHFWQHISDSYTDAKSSKIGRNLKRLKIKYLLWDDLDKTDTLEALTKFENLESLRLGDMLYLNGGKIVTLDDASVKTLPALFAKITTKLPKLTELNMNNVCDDKMLKLVSPNLKRLQHFKVASNKVSDEGLKELFSVNSDLVTIDVSGCQRLNGDCFEELISFKLTTLRVSFDEYRLKCLRELLINRGILKCRIINRVP